MTRAYRAGLASLLAVDDAVERIIGALEDGGVLGVLLEGTQELVEGGIGGGHGP